MELSSTLTLEMLGEPFLLEKRIRLLHAITEHGSISKAARAVPMSYKSAWEAVETMNNLAAEPIVLRVTGGKNGGGTRITAYGKRLLETYSVLKEEHTRFLKRLSSLHQLEEGEIGSLARLSVQISARNQIGGRVMSLACGSVHAEVTLVLKNGEQLQAVITKEAAEHLGLQKGDEAIAIFKSNSVQLLGRETDKKEMTSNRLKGEVIRMIGDAERVEVIVEIGRADTVVSVTARHKMPVDVKEGSKVVLTVDRDHVMIGR
jgi:molybdate transport system regulatory protein